MKNSLELLVRSDCKQFVIASFAAAAVVSLNPYFGDCLRPFLTY
jgi:hypothetical protein